MRTIFVITVITPPRDRNVAMADGSVRLVPDQRSSRAWGWYADLEKARDALARNLTDLHETIYDDAVIEEVEEGVCPEIVAEHWFRFDHAANGYVPCDKPADLANQAHFGIG
jgi:prepilin-type processing-associated H-X9-DG protein